MAHIYFAIVRGVEMDGTFATVSGDKVNLAGDVEEFCTALKASRSRLRDVEPGDMTVFRPWASKPSVAVWTAALANGDESCDPAAILSNLVRDKKCAYFIVRIPASPPVAALGA